MARTTATPTSKMITAMEIPIIFISHTHPSFESGAFQ
jgi:hypothetical protein